MSEQFEQVSIPKVNNNPFLPDGRIHRMSFFLTTLLISLIAVYFYGVIADFTASEGFLILEAAGGLSLVIVTLQIFACIKRCRDIKNSPWCVLLLFVPLIGCVYSLFLLFKGSRYPD